jgi:hypothetical protein
MSNEKWRTADVDCVQGMRKQEEVLVHSRVKTGCLMKKKRFTNVHFLRQ